ncbi:MULTISPECIES: tRNA (N(6)-L-threonylcarbamoyladenosine(37)-C(2))-methylthiotransferase [Methanosphaera]|uniref:tRNA-t(6)A37 methylthiotransferase n=2 Tax=Methanosphaera stadtmanae TaxID=2317 RepID=Q2NHC4_METST|nr:MULTISPECIES: tRNA (N(6)-L-threonylcarbamoyladenosine(37)-C(2))-methylthiotransferase [Methanosphaera]ABC56779.1 predicted 2-methylthioadenine synthetase [Methanosphaera stadtmanae DSM 3091]MEE0489382.1 tRNA (N(6)-L-threonylcarbamoyladenosine(37)-C(2))-methylthiotransferase [Methanosphaera stadtmanae]OEC87241.1 threonylcarbamoyladenosine tRNA methylthiotransferase [Methanosphaera sp. A6]RAP03512.1 threonylcarbamoyladenosine tRNA methylthiotransferase [Methanosphaera stadtmanae]RAP48268.1 MA
MKIYLETHGCTFNQADTDIMANILAKKYDIVYDVEEADVIILNTCYVKLPTEQKMITKIRKYKTEFPDKKLIIGGCMVEVDDKRLEKFAGDDCWIGPHKLDKVDEVVEKAINGEVVHEYGKTRAIKAGKGKKNSESLVHILQICEGCNGQCTFCCTRIARGFLISYPIDVIVEEAKDAVEHGCKELQVTAQDTACFGMDTGESFADLLNKLGAIEGDFRIRVGMMNPQSIKNQLHEVIDAFKNNDKIFNFVHLPIQSGSPKVLKEMNRKHTLDEYKYILNEFRKEIPQMSLATDIIVGYPTETEEDFNQTLELLKEIKPDIVHISKYMHRPGAKSNHLKEIDHNIMKNRSHRVNQVKTEVMLEKNKEYENTIQNVLITSKGSSGGYVGYTDSYKNVIVDEAEIGSFMDVKIIEGKRTYLLAQRI